MNGRRIDGELMVVQPSWDSPACFEENASDLDETLRI